MTLHALGSRAFADRMKPGGAAASMLRPLWLAALSASLAVLFLLLYVAGRGFDITDEAYYLLFIASPEQYFYSGTMFGHLLSPLFDLSSRDIATFRRLSIVLLAAMCATCWFAWRAPEASKSMLWNTVQAVSLCGLAFGLLGTFWLPTPSYNWLAVFASFALLAAMGLLARNSAWPWAAALAAIAGLCALASRPPAAVAMALIYAAAVGISAQSVAQAVRNFAAAGLVTVVCAVLLGVFVVDVFAIGQQYQNFVQLWMHSDAILSRVWIALFEFAIDPSEGLILLIGLGLVALVARRRGRERSQSLIMVGAFCALILILPQDTAHGVTLLMRMTGVALALICLAMLLNPDSSARESIVLALATTIPFVAFLGTGSLIASSAFQASGITAVIIVLATAKAFGSSVASIPTIGLTLLLGHVLWGSMAAPYRLPASIWQQSFPFEIPFYGTLYFDHKTHAMFASSRRAATEHALEVGTPVLDLTGQSPGIVMAMGGVAPGTPWLVGGYDWSDRQLVAVLNSMTKTARDKAWVLWGQSPRGVNRERMAQLGIELDEGYQLVAEIPHASQDWKIGIYAPR